MARFSPDALFSDYYRRIGLDHALAVAGVARRNDELVSIVFNRRGHDFSDRDWRSSMPLRRPLFAAVRARARRRGGVAPWGLRRARARCCTGWPPAKTDREIALIVGCSARTVHSTSSTCTPSRRRNAYRGG